MKTKRLVLLSYTVRFEVNTEVGLDEIEIFWADVEGLLLRSGAEAHSHFA